MWMSSFTPMSQLNIFMQLEPDLLVILVINIAVVMVVIRRWWNLKLIPAEMAVTADDFVVGFDDIDFEEEDDNEEDITSNQHVHRPQDISVAVECTFETSEDNRDLMYIVRVTSLGESVLLMKRHRDFGLLFRHMCRANPEVIDLKRLIRSTGNLSPTTGKLLKWANFDDFLSALAALEQWPIALSVFFSEIEDFNEKKLLSDMKMSASIEEIKVNANEQRLVSELSVEQKTALNQIVSQVDTKGIIRHLWPGDTVNKYCLRLLKARKFDVSSSVKMLQEDQKWRNENNWRQKVKQSKPLDVIGMSFDSVEKYLPIWHQGFDKTGRPISIQKMGCVRLPILLAETTLEKMTDFQTHQTEHLVELCGQTQTESWVVIIDAANFDSKNLFYRNAFKWAAKMNELDAGHNPERLGQMFIINAPQVVYTFFSMISYLLDEVTAKKIQLFTTMDQWGPVLQEVVDSDQLPPEYGGTGTNNLRREFGQPPLKSVP